MKPSSSRIERICRPSEWVGISKNAAEIAFAVVSCANDRGEPQFLGCVNDTSLFDQFRVAFPHDIPNVPVDAAALRQSSRDRPYDVSMPVGEKECAEELGRRRMTSAKSDRVTKKPDVLSGSENACTVPRISSKD